MCNCLFQCGIRTDTSVSAGCGMRPQHISRTRRRTGMRIPWWCSSRGLWHWALLFTWCAAWHQMHGRFSCCWPGTRWKREIVLTIRVRKTVWNAHISISMPWHTHRGYIDTINNTEWVIHTICTHGSKYYPLTLSLRRSHLAVVILYAKISSIYDISRQWN